MSKKEKIIESEDSVYLLGSIQEDGKRGFSKKRWVTYGIVAITIILFAAAGIMIYHNLNIEYNYEPENGVTKLATSINARNTPNNDKMQGYIEVEEETVNDVPLFIYIPHNAHPYLTFEQPKQTDSTAIFVAYAADIRADNHQVVSDFVVAGKRIARGQRKKGYCAIINHEIFIGCGDETGYMSKAINQKGFFFRQYPLVHEGKIIDNVPKNKSIRKALAKRGNQIVMIESRSRESFHDFAQALVDIGITNAIYLVSGNSYGWYITKSGEKVTFGNENAGTVTKGTNYIVWQSY